MLVKPDYDFSEFIDLKVPKTEDEIGKYRGFAINKVACGKHTLVFGSAAAVDALQTFQEFVQAHPGQEITICRRTKFCESVCFSTIFRHNLFFELFNQFLFFSIFY